MAKPKASKLHQKLHLQHHRHTGKLLHHRHTSYRGIAVVLVLAGTVIVGLNAMARVTADSLYVYARNPAPVPTSAAVITDPIDGTKVASAPHDVSGTCPVITPNVIVAIYDNGILAGSVACDSDNTFHLSIVLVPGLNTLVARTFTITGDSGPDSTPVRITYFIPTPPTVSQQYAGPPLVLTIDEPFIVFGPAKVAVWLGTISGGTTPYHITIGWGDGSSSTYTITEPGQQHFQHRYRSMRPHDITFHVTDADGRNIVRHYAAVTPYLPPVTGSTSAVPPLGGGRLFGLYGAYLLLLVVFGTLWLRAHPYAYAKVPAHRRRTVTKHRLRARH